MEDEKVQVYLTSILGVLNEEQLTQVESDVDGLRTQITSGITTIKTFDEERTQLNSDLQTATLERDEIKRKYFDRFINGGSDPDLEEPTPPVEKPIKKSLDELFGKK